MKKREEDIIRKANQQALRQKQAKLRLDQRRLKMLKLRETDLENDQAAMKEQGTISNPVIPMMKEFSMLYPELVEKYQIKYPIEDKILLSMSLIHKIENQPSKPEPKIVKIGGHRFEKLIKVWEHFFTFGEYLSLPRFQLEDLEAALRY